MSTQPTIKPLFRVSTLILCIATLISSCSRPEPAEPDATLPARYELKDIRYFFSTGDRVDTTTIQLKGTSVQNPGSTSATQQVKEDLSELVKTSLFTIDPTAQLPKEVDLSKFNVSVPQHWYGNGLFDRSIETYPLSFTQQQKPYGFTPESTSTINVPPKSRIDISRQVDAYQLRCSFECILENTATGQRYTLSGKWNGLLQYNNLAVTLKQSAI